MVHHDPDKRGRGLVHQDQVPPVLLQFQEELTPPRIHVGGLVPVGGGLAALPERGVARLPVVLPVPVRLVVRLTDDQAFDGLDERTWSVFMIAPAMIGGRVWHEIQPGR